MTECAREQSLDVRAFMPDGPEATAENSVGMRREIGRGRAILQARCCATKRTVAAPGGEKRARERSKLSNIASQAGGRNKRTMPLPETQPRALLNAPAVRRQVETSPGGFYFPSRLRLSLALALFSAAARW